MKIIRDGDKFDIKSLTRSELELVKMSFESMADTFVGLKEENMMGDLNPDGSIMTPEEIHFWLKQAREDAVVLERMAEAMIPYMNKEEN